MPELQRSSPTMYRSRSGRQRTVPRAAVCAWGTNAGLQGAHFGPALARGDPVRGVLEVDPQRTRDRLILSKGHGSLALYTVLHE